MSEDSGYPGAPPGWYADPAGGPGQRWWDGYAWSEAVVVPQQPPPAPSWAGAPPPQGPPLQQAPWATATQRLDAHYTSGLIARELAIAPAARFLLTVPAVIGLLDLVLVRTQSSQLLLFGQQLRTAYDDAAHGLTAPPITAPLSPWFSLLGVVALGALVVVLVWQHRAASAARALGFPTTHSPAWGVGSWFVPVVNLWFPYQAIRDCLPPGDPNRIQILRWWVAYMVAGGVGAGAFFAAFFSSGLAVALSIPAALLWIALLTFAPRVVPAVMAAHRRALPQ